MGRKKASTTGGTTADPKKDFLLAALNMSWQLAVVVLVPIIGGFKLDELLGSLPALTILGFIVAMVGMGFVVWRQMTLFTPTLPKTKRGNK